MMNFPKCTCSLTALLFFCLGMTLDSWMLPPEYRVRIRLALLILNFALSSFLVSIGLLLHRVSTNWKEKWTKAFGYEPPYDVRNFCDMCLGFCLAFLVLPFWLGVREVTFDSLAKGDSVNSFSVAYLELLDVVCYTPLFPRLANELGHCEAIGYSLPLLLFTGIPIRFVIYLFRNSSSQRIN